MSNSNRFTKETPFFSASSDNSALFSVRSGIGLKDALESASTLLDAAKQTTEGAAIEFDSATIWAASYLIEMSKAVVNSALTAINMENKHV